MKRTYVCLVIVLATFKLSWAIVNADSLKAECWEHTTNTITAYGTFVTTQDRAWLVTGIAEAAKASLLVAILDREYPDALPHSEDADLIRMILASLCSMRSEYMGDRVSRFVTEPTTDPKYELAPFAVWLTIFEIKAKKVFGIKK